MRHFRSPETCRNHPETVVVTVETLFSNAANKSIPLTSIISGVLQNGIIVFNSSEEIYSKWDESS